MIATHGPFTLSVSFSVSAAQTLIHIVAPTDRHVLLNYASITQSENDASEQYLASITKVASGSATGTDGASLIQKTLSQHADASATVTYNLTGEPTYETEHYNQVGWNSLEGYSFAPPKCPWNLHEDERPILKPSEALGLRLLDSPSGATVYIAEITWSEYSKTP